ncbi:hypothetical protein H1W37_18965 [Stappia taiwanensis]|uniref:Uncharacterized protein n=1 Tax=Stappia taiwanensis TaxID=992267 RepID=A0A838XTI5_9HYPH|nr:hypothetical protein [Stappia taiwanensis]GGE93707.1 hypothetical protein GCM10007285_21700 [Stappia taiwanensis]
MHTPHFTKYAKFFYIATFSHIRLGQSDQVDLSPVLRPSCPATDLRFACRGDDVVQTRERMCGLIGYAKTIRVDNGSEFVDL